MVPICMGTKTDYMRNVHEFAINHKDDLPSFETLEQELRMWFLKYINVEDKPATLQHAYKEAGGSVNFPNVAYLLKVLLTIPCTSASTERANSTLKFIKTRLRSSLAQKSLNAFILGYKHKDLLYQLKLETILQRFVSCKRRRLSLLNPISE